MLRHKFALELQLVVVKPALLLPRYGIRRNDLGSSVSVPRGTCAVTEALRHTAVKHRVSRRMIVSSCGAQPQSRNGKGTTRGGTSPLSSRVARGASTPTGSQWCRIRSLWDEYSESIHDDRYRRINPCSYDTWGTLEIRLAPMGRDAGESEAMILAGMHAVDRWIAGGGTPASATVTAPPIKGGIHRLGGSRPTRTATGSGTLQIRTHGDLDDDDR